MEKVKGNERVIGEVAKDKNKKYYGEKRVKGKNNENEMNSLILHNILVMRTFRYLEMKA